jgi:hypothetical protein
MKPCACCGQPAIKAGHRCAACAISCKRVDGAFIAGAMCPALGRLRVAPPKRKRPEVAPERGRVVKVPVGPRDGVGLVASMRRDG